MTDVPPILLTYDGDGDFSAPSPHWKAMSDRHYVIGERYMLVQHNIRSHNSHSHFFAALKDSWANLPTEWQLLLPSVEHMRKYCLIKSGWCSVQVFPMADHEGAMRLRRELKSHDEFAIVTVTNNIVTQSVAKSQSYRSMGKEDFGRSKSDCLAVAAELLGTTQKALESNQGASAEARR